MAAIITLATKDLRLLWRDKFGLFWVLGFPLVYGLFFGAIMGNMGPSKSRPLSIAVVEESVTADHDAFLKRLEASDSLKLTRMPREKATNAVRLGKRTAYLEFKEKKKDGGFDFFGANMPSIHVGIDPSRQAEAGYLQGILMESSFKDIETMFTDTTKMKERTAEASALIDADKDMPFARKLLLKTFFGSLDAFMGGMDTQDVAEQDSAKQDSAKESSEKNTSGGFGKPQIEFVSIAHERTGPRSGYEITFPAAILWGLMGCAASFAVSILRERKDGTLLRLFCAPITRADILLGKALSCFLACSAITSMLLIIGTFALGVQFDNPANLALAILCSSACFVGVMMLMSVIGKTEQAVSGGGWGIMVLMAMIGGGMIPLIAMPKWMLTLSNISPVAWGITSLEGAIWRDYSFVEMLRPCGLLLGLGVFGFAAGWHILRRRGL